MQVIQAFAADPQVCAARQQVGLGARERQPAEVAQRRQARPAAEQTAEVRRADPGDGGDESGAQPVSGSEMSVICASNCGFDNVSVMGTVMPGLALLFVPT